MGNLEDLDARIQQIENRRLAIEQEIKALTIESVRLYREQTLLANEKYRKYLDLSDHEENPEVLSQAAYDASFSSGAANALVEWIQSFGKNFLEGWGTLNDDGMMPSAILGFEEDEEITEETVSSISRFASLVHGESEYTVFDIREYGYKTTGEWFLIVTGENFDRGTVLTWEEIPSVFSAEVIAPLSETLKHISQNHWML